MVSNIEGGGRTRATQYPQKTPAANINKCLRPRTSNTEPNERHMRPRNLQTGAQPKNACGHVPRARGQTKDACGHVTRKRGPDKKSLRSRISSTEPNKRRLRPRNPQPIERPPDGPKFISYVFSYVFSHVFSYFCFENHKLCFLLYLFLCFL